MLDYGNCTIELCHDLLNKSRALTSSKDPSHQDSASHQCWHQGWSPLLQIQANEVLFSATQDATDVLFSDQHLLNSRTFYKINFTAPSRRLQTPTYVLSWCREKVMKTTIYYSLFTIHYSTCMQSMWCDKNKQTHGISSRSICLLANSGVNMAYSWTSESTDFTTLDNQDPVDQMPLQSPL